MKLSCWWRKGPALTAAGRGRARRAAAILLLVGTAASAAAQDASPGRIFATRADPQFGDAAPPLRAYLARAKPRWRGPQHFCVVGYRQPSGDRMAQVHWREGRRLILWEGASDPAYARDAIRDSRRDLDLTHDVVVDTAAVGGSTYLVTRAWVRRVLADCARGGMRYTLHR